MSQEDRDSLNDLAAALAALPVAQSGIDRDRLMFEAGRAAAESEVQTSGRGAAPARWLWPAATAAMTTAALLLGVALMLNPPAPPGPVAAPEQNAGDGKQPPEGNRRPPGGLAASAHAGSREDLLQLGQRVSYVGFIPPPSIDAARTDNGETWKAHSPELLEELLGS